MKSPYLNQKLKEFLDNEENDEAVRAAILVLMARYDELVELKKHLGIELTKEKSWK